MQNNQFSISSVSFYGRPRRPASQLLNRIPVHVNNPYVPDPNESEEGSDSDEDDIEHISESDGSEYACEEDFEDSCSDDDGDDNVSDDGDDNISGDDGHGNANNDGDNGNVPYQGASKEPKMNVRWRKRNPVQFDVKYSGPQFPQPPDEELDPLQYFKMFFDDELFEHLAEQTNLYSVQKTGVFVNTTSAQMEQ